MLPYAVNLAMSPTSNVRSTTNAYIHPYNERYMTWPSIHSVLSFLPSIQPNIQRAILSTSYSTRQLAIQPSNHAALQKTNHPTMLPALNLSTLLTNHSSTQPSFNHRSSRKLSLRLLSYPSGLQPFHAIIQSLIHSSLDSSTHP